MRARSIISALALLLAALLACGRSELLEPRTHAGPDAGRRPDAWTPGPFDAGHGADAGAPGRDAGRTPDAGPKPGQDAGTCLAAAPWKLESRSIKAVRRVSESFAGARQGSSVALEVDVQLLSSCDELARVDLGLMPGDATDFVTLNAFAWVQQGGACDPVAPVATTAAFVPGRGAGNLRVVVSDGSAPGGGLRLTYEVAHCTTGDCWCDAWAPPGKVQEFQACQTDCDCAAGLSCLAARSPAGIVWSCFRPCTKQTDCPQSGCNSGAQTLWVCSNLDACPYPEDCPDGFSCVIRDSPSFCEDERAAPTVEPCRCDAECPPGQRCIQGFRETPTCEIPCADHQDCPFDWLVCGTPGFCVPLGP